MSRSGPAPFDFLDLSSQLTEDERMVRDTAARFVDEEILPIAEACSREGRFPRELVPKFGALGLFGVNLSGYGLPGLGDVAYGVAMMEIERGDSAFRSLCSVQGSLVMFPILRYGSDAQKRRWLPALAEGRALGCFGLTEPDHGSDPQDLETRAVRRGDRIVLDGAKMWITNGTVADVAVVWAKNEAREIRGYLVEAGTPGFTAPEMTGKHSLRASVTSELVFQGCAIPLENELPGATGLKAPLSCLSQARYGIAWGAIGAATACLRSALDDARARKRFGKPTASFQLVQKKFADMVTALTASQLIALRVGRLKEAGTVHPAQISMAKRHNVRAALEIARTCRDILGANGILGEFPVMRHMANLESVITYEGTDDIHALILGREITGLDAFG